MQNILSKYYCEFEKVIKMFWFTLFSTLFAFQTIYAPQCTDMRRMNAIEKINFLKSLGFPEDVLEDNISYLDVNYKKEYRDTEIKEGYFLEIGRYDAQDKIIIDQFELRRKIFGAFSPRLFAASHIFFSTTFAGIFSCSRK